MSFIERYNRIVEREGIDPCSQQAADRIGTTRSSISQWGTKKMAPSAKFLISIANAYRVSTDYLLERTDDPTDWTDDKMATRRAHEIIESHEGDGIDRAEALRKVRELDELDLIKATAYLDGLLSAEKYRRMRRA